MQLRFGVCIRLARLLRLKIPSELLDQADFEKRKLQEKLRESALRRDRRSQIEIRELVPVEGEHFRPSRDESGTADPNEEAPSNVRAAVGGRMPRSRGSVERQLESLARTRVTREEKRAFALHCHQNRSQVLETELDGELEMSVIEEGAVGLREARERRPSYLDLWPEWPPRNPAHAMPHMCCQLRSLLKYVLRELQTLSNHVHHDMADDVVRTQWHFVADVVDRFLFTLFLIFAVRIPCS